MALQLSNFTDEAGVLHNTVYVRLVELHLDRKIMQAQLTVKVFTSRANSQTKRELSGGTVVFFAPLGDFTITGNLLSQAYTWLKANTVNDVRLDLSAAQDVLE